MIKGIVRKLDELGRITLPMEYRKMLVMVPGESVDMSLDGKVIRLQVFEKGLVKGVVRNLDHLGRVTLPMEYRRSLHINLSDLVDMYLDGPVVCIKAVKLQCAICGSEDEKSLMVIDEVHICRACAFKVVDKVMGD